MRRRQNDGVGGPTPEGPRAAFMYIYIYMYICIYREGFATISILLQYIYIYLCIYVYMYVCIEFGDTFFYLEGHAHKISNVMKMNGLAKAIEFVNPKLSGTERI